MHTKYNIIDRFLEMMVQAYLNHHGAISMVWTVNRRKLFFHVANPFANSFYSIYNKLGNSFNDYKEILINPSQYIKSSYNFQTAAKISDLTNFEIESVYEFLLKGFVAFRIDSETFNPHKSLWLSDAELNDLLKLINFNSIENEIDLRMVNELHASLRAYCESIYLDDHTIGGDIHGPYDLSPLHNHTKSLLIRDYNRMRPTELISELEEFEYSMIKTYCIYETDDISIDMLGNINSRGNTAKQISSYLVIAYTPDGEKRILATDEISRLIAFLDKFTFYYVKKVTSSSEFEQSKAIILCEHYAMKPLFDEAGLDWRPTNGELDLLKTKKVPDRYKELKKLQKHYDSINDEAGIISIATELLDPRIKWEA